MSTILVAYLISGSCATFFANQARRDQEYNIKKANRSLPPYQYESKAHVKSEFPEYIFEKHGFAVRFPEEPIVTNVGRKVHYAATVEGEKAVYSIFVTTYSRPLNTDAYLEAYLQSRLVLLGDKSKLIRSNKVLFLGYRALDYEYAETTGSVTKYYKGVKFVVGEGNLTYTVSLACAEEIKVIAYARYDDFVKSFRLRE